MSRCSVVLLALLSPAALADNPHDRYVFWLPAGELRLGDAEREQAFGFAREPDGQRLTLRPRATRMGVARGQMVLVVRDAPAGAVRCSVDGAEIGPLGPVTFLPVGLTAGKEQVELRTFGDALGPETTLLVYYTDDAWALGETIEGDLRAWAPTGAAAEAYREGLLALWEGEYAAAAHALREGATGAPSADAARLLRRLARWAEAEERYPDVESARGAYDLGLYAMVNGLWDLAARCFRQATEREPGNADAWYMLGDALSYRDSDLDTRMRAIAPCYVRAAELYPRANANTYRNHIAFFRRFRVDADTVLTMTDEQMAYAREAWEWCSAIMESASRGALRMENTYHVVDEEVDNTQHFDPRPFEGLGLFRRGEAEALIKMTGWGASDALGHDCGPNRSAAINLGIREWDVMLHEWNHTLDWLVIQSELGVGVPATHSSDWTGFEPIPSMGMGHHSTNRYYMTPGMYRLIRGSDPATTPYVDAWRISRAARLCGSAEEVTGEWTAEARAKAGGVRPISPAELPETVTAHEGWVDLGAALPNAPRNAYAFAHTYVYSPTRQRVRAWLAADDNVRVWVNGQLAHKGLYWACCLFQEAREKDQIAAALTLEAGWNSLLLQVTDLQAAPDWLTPDVARPNSWGFSLRLCDAHNGPAPGLRFQPEKPAGWAPPRRDALDPAAPRTYEWSEVAHDYTHLLPALTVDDLRAITGDAGLALTDEVLIATGAAGDRVLARADPAVVRFDNQVNWFFSPREMAGFVRYARGGTARDLLFLRPEGYEPFLRLLPVTPEARARGVRSHAAQVIGYVTVPREDSANGRILLVVDTYLGDALPEDEEDLLSLEGLS